MKHHSKSIQLLILASFFSILGIVSSAALPRSFMAIDVNGTRLQGYTSIQEIGGVDLSEFIELKSFEYEMLTDARGGFQVSPFKLTKFIDKATPLLAQALATNARIDAEINIFGNDPDTGETRLETTITLEQAKISSVRVWNTTAAGTPQLCEEIQITYHRIVIANVIGSTETTIQNPASP